MTKQSSSTDQSPAPSATDKGILPSSPRSPGRLVRWRRWVQAGFLLLWLDPLRLQTLRFCSPVFHCYACPLAFLACPIGVLAQFSALHVIPWVAIGTLALIGSIGGSMVCGWACPFGFFQDLVARFAKPRFHLPAWTSPLRYVVLAGLVLLIPFLWGENHALFICRVCPAGALEGAAPNMISQLWNHQAVSWPSAIKIVVVALFLAAMFFMHRPWCALFCPLGAIYSLFNRFSLLSLRFSPDNCRNCGHCEKSCPHGLHPKQGAEDLRCIRCLECSRCGACRLK
ncbi:MAG: 4Fe-4S binding protein [Verrucomicrobiae bacterium]|nr:4Fe-4S binding protein [Verrucomicrobiae bacterium]